MPTLPLGLRSTAMTLRTRLLTLVIAVTVVTLASLLTLAYTQTSSMAEKSAEQYLDTLAGREAATVDAQGQSAFIVLRALANELASLQRQGKVNRQDVVDMIRNVAADHPEFVGMSTGWEPNAFDGQDAQFANTRNSDATGRFLPYFFWADGKVDTAYLVDYDKPGAGDWYLVPKATGKELLTDPYVYPIDGVDVLMATASVPIMSQGKFMGVVTVDFALDSLSKAVSEIKPYGKGYAAMTTASGIIVAHPNKDQLMKPAQGALATAVSEVAKSGKPQLMKGEDSLIDGDAFTVVQPVKIGNEGVWVLTLVAPKSEVLSAVNHMRNVFLLLGALGILASCIAALWVARSVTRPLNDLKTRIADIADGEGDLTKRLDESRDDEVGAVAKAFNRFADKISSLVREINNETSRLDSSAQGLAQASTKLASNSAESSARTESAADAAASVSDSVRSVAAAAEQMGASIQEISRSVVEATAVGGNAVDTARTTHTTVSALGDSSQQIGEVVKVITSIAEQTNLLALNATIEAARAGEAGKGFAVVASEVKELAQETGQATERITQLIDTIQGDTQAAVVAINEITNVIEQVNEYQTRISAAVEQQTATAQDMSRGAAQAAEMVEHISETVVDVRNGVQSSATVGEDVDNASREMSQLVDELSSLTRQFKVSS